MVENLRQDSIAHKMTSEVPTATTRETIGKILNRLSRESKLFDNIDYIYVLNKAGKLVGVVSIRELF
ncbi:CBS domain-containing protein, partial [Candidatus Woesearchaeota archaeon]|nr:CBS domain-containing protein [Candidatus Woesearchaeota archaeon]